MIKLLRYCCFVLFVLAAMHVSGFQESSRNHIKNAQKGYGEKARTSTAKQKLVLSDVEMVEKDSVSDHQQRTLVGDRTIPNRK